MGEQDSLAMRALGTGQMLCLLMGSLLLCEAFCFLLALSNEQ